jgi:conjugative relaxase-like TrwC/TraI family protein
LHRGCAAGSRDLLFVVSIGKLGGGPGAERYYTDAVARGQEDYYSGDGEAEGEWFGAGAQQLGLAGAVDEDDFSALLRGTSPRSGTRLRSEPTARSVIGFDITFSAPKSVSVLYGIAESRIARATRDAHDEAVRQALGYLERSACGVRRGHGGTRRLGGEGLTVATFRHRSSRAGDPQLHTHAVIANMTKANGRWSTLDGRLVYAHARTAGFLYQAALRDQLTRELGVEWTAVKRGVAEIRRIDADVLRHFSRRREEIRERMATRGDRSARAAQAAALDTRRRKTYDVPVNRMREEWRARAAEHGLTRDDLSGLIGRCRAAALPDERFLSSDAGLTGAASTFDRRDVLREWAEAHVSGASVAQVEQLADAWLASPEAVRLSDPKDEPLRGARYSTPAMLETELELVECAQRRMGEGAGRARDGHVDAALTARPELADEQAALIRGLTQSGDGVQVVRAAAGTGKTYALEAARHAWEASGYRVYGCALSARAAVELESQSGIDSTTIARLRLDIAHGYGLDERNVLIVDEAGMVGSRTLAELSAHAEAARAKLVLVGDDRQLPEIDAGGGFRGVAERVGALELHETRRQSNEWDRQALASLRTGEIESWATEYRERGRLVARMTARELRDTLVSDWWQSARTPGIDAVMIAHRRTDVAELNARAREYMGQDRRLGEEIEAGDRSFACGDQVLAKHNERRLGITNGSRATVVAVDPERHALTVELADGRRTDLDAAYLEQGHLDHGYALTAHAAQGATVDRAFVLGSDDLYREWGYTALTRHRDEARFYLVSPGSTERCLPGLEPENDPLVEDLAEMLGESRRKSLAIEELARDPATYSEVHRDTRPDDAVAEHARAEVERRLAALRAERAELSLLRRGRRAELDAQIELQLRAVAHWRQELDRADSPAPDDVAISPPEPTVDIDHLRCAVAGSPRPDSLWEREGWVHQVLHEMDVEAGLDPLPEIDLEVPDFDFGP